MASIVDQKVDRHKAITTELGDFISSKASTFACGGSVVVVSMMGPDFSGSHN